MRQRLLLDENLSERLLPLLIETFPESTHVRPVGLGGASDTEIWQWASLHGAWRGESHPRLHCLAIGNANNATTAMVLLQQAMAIEQFCLYPEAGFLLLGPSASGH